MDSSLYTDEVIFSYNTIDKWWLKIMNYEEAVAYIEETPKFTKKNSLEHTKECLRRLGNPQEYPASLKIEVRNAQVLPFPLVPATCITLNFSCGFPSLLKHSFVCSRLFFVVNFGVSSI